MKKLTLDVDRLAVESFPTAEIDAEARGTVDAQEATNNCNTRGVSCFTSCRGNFRDGCTCPV